MTEDFEEAAEFIATVKNQQLIDGYTSGAFRHDMTFTILIDGRRRESTARRLLVRSESYFSDLVNARSRAR